MKAPWAQEFSKHATAPLPFHLLGGKASTAPTMVQVEMLGYMKKSGFTAVTLPYVGGDLQFLILLPDGRDGLADLEQKITAATLAECAKAPQREVHLFLPKFKLTPETMELGDALKSLGMKTAFDQPRGSANFDRMAPRTPNEYLFISNVFHKTFLALDEVGTEAAAATAVSVAVALSAPAPRPEPIEVRVDRPFLFAIQHTASGACLFLGRVTDPR